MYNAYIVLYGILYGRGLTCVVAVLLAESRLSCPVGARATKLLLSSCSSAGLSPTDLLANVPCLVLIFRAKPP